MDLLYLILYLYVHTLSHLTCRAAATSSSNSQLLQNDVFALDDYEVLSFREEGDEDIVHIRKRTDQDDCFNDCMSYSGWTDDGTMQCEPEDIGSEDILARNLLLGRNRKPTKSKYVEFTLSMNISSYFFRVCSNALNSEGVAMEGFKLFSPTWPKVEHLEKVEIIELYFPNM